MNLGGYEAMTDKQLKRLSRADLLELLLIQTKENERLHAELEEARAQLESRRICVEEAGSIANAALALNGVMEAAQAAADQYLENIAQIKAEAEQLRREAEEMKREAEEKLRKACVGAE
jgi:glutathione S-transferase